jgi:hypothetical protein
VSAVNAHTPPPPQKINEMIARWLGPKGFSHRGTVKDRVWLLVCVEKISSVHIESMMNNHPLQYQPVVNNNPPQQQQQQFWYMPTPYQPAAAPYGANVGGRETFGSGPNMPPYTTHTPMPSYTTHTPMPSYTTHTPMPSFPERTPSPERTPPMARRTGAASMWGEAPRLSASRPCEFLDSNGIPCGREGAVALEIPLEHERAASVVFGNRKNRYMVCPAHAEDPSVMTLRSLTTGELFDTHSSVLKASKERAESQRDTEHFQYSNKCTPEQNSLRKFVTMTVVQLGKNAGREGRKTVSDACQLFLKSVRGLRCVCEQQPTTTRVSDQVTKTYESIAENIIAIYNDIPQHVTPDQLLTVARVTWKIRKVIVALCRLSKGSETEHGYMLAVQRIQHILARASGIMNSSCEEGPDRSRSLSGMAKAMLVDMLTHMNKNPAYMSALSPDHRLRQILVNPPVQLKLLWGQKETGAKTYRPFMQQTLGDGGPTDDSSLLFRLGGSLQNRQRGGGGGGGYHHQLGRNTHRSQPVKTRGPANWRRPETAQDFRDPDAMTAWGVPDILGGDIAWKGREDRRADDPMDYLPKGHASESDMHRGMETHLGIDRLAVAGPPKRPSNGGNFGKYYDPKTGELVFGEKPSRPAIVEPSKAQEQQLRQWFSGDSRAGEYDSGLFEPSSFWDMKPTVSSSATTPLDAHNWMAFGLLEAQVVRAASSMLRLSANKDMIESVCGESSSEQTLWREGLDSYVACVVYMLYVFGPSILTAGENQDCEC